MIIQLFLCCVSVFRPKSNELNFLRLLNYRWITCALVGCAPPWNSIVPYASVGCGRVCLFGIHKSPSNTVGGGGMKMKTY